MAKMSAKNAVIIIEDTAGGAGTLRTVSSDCISFSLEYNVSPLDTTGFGDGSKNYIPGLPVIGFSLEFLWNSTAATGITTVLLSILGSTTSKTCSIKPDPAGLTMSGEFMLDGFAPSGKPDGVLAGGTAHFSVMGAAAPTWA